MADGTFFDIPVNVTISDAVPTLTLGEATGAFNSIITGSIDLDFGADSEGTVKVSLNNGSQIAGIKNDNGEYDFAVGNYTLHLDPVNKLFTYDGVPASGHATDYTFTFTITDSDGSEVTASTTATLLATNTENVNAEGASSDADILENHILTVNNLPEGAILVSDEYQGQFGKILVDSEGKAYYQQSRAVDHSQGNVSDTLALKATLADGTIFDIPVNVTISDASPTLTLGEASGAFNSVITGSIDLDFGADSEGTVKVSESCSRGSQSGGQPTEERQRGSA